MTAVAVMQPYFFPYIGYYQMIAMVDEFVFLDDANFIVRGFVNRNNILNRGGKYLITVPVKAVSQNRPINDHHYVDGNGECVLEVLRAAYSTAPYLDTVLALVNKVFVDGDANVAITNALSITRVMEYLDIKPIWGFSSKLLPCGKYKGQEWILEIAQLLNASKYINLPGGKGLYDSSRFERAGIKLEFVSPVFTSYQQGSEPFVAGLSILDALMWRDPTEVKLMLQSARAVVV